MTTLISPLAGKPAPRSLLVDVPRLVTGYYTGLPDPTVQSQRVAFGTSGHRGSSLDLSFNEQHVQAITQAICQYRQSQEITGPLFLGIDTHALSQPACSTALEVLAANGVDVMLATNDDYTPTPAVSHAILAYNRGRTSGLADGIVVTPSHNPGQWRLQVQPAQRWPCGFRHHRRHRGRSEPLPRDFAYRCQADVLCASIARGDDTPP